MATGPAFQFQVQRLCCNNGCTASLPRASMSGRADVVAALLAAHAEAFFKKTL